MKEKLFVVYLYICAVSSMMMSLIYFIIKNTSFQSSIDTSIHFETSFLFRNHQLRNNQAIFKNVHCIKHFFVVPNLCKIKNAYLQYQKVEEPFERNEQLFGAILFAF